MLYIIYIGIILMKFETKCVFSRTHQLSIKEHKAIKDVIQFSIRNLGTSTGVFLHKKHIPELIAQLQDFLIEPEIDIFREFK